MAEPFVLLGQTEEDEVWKRYNCWTPPTPNIVYHIDLEALYRDNAVLEADFYGKLMRAFRASLGPHEWLYALDWQHDCYRFWPDRMIKGGKWAVPLIPDGDYYYFLSEDFRLGMLGYLYGESGNEADEPAICVFGEDMVRLIAPDPPLIVTHVVRQMG